MAREGGLQTQPRAESHLLVCPAHRQTHAIDKELTIWPYHICSAYSPRLGPSTRT